MRVTNRDKYMSAYESLKERGDAYIKTLFPDGLPATLFYIGHGYEVQEKQVTGAYYAFGYYRPIEGKKVTNVQVFSIQAAVLDDKPLMPEKVYLSCTFAESYGRCTCDYNLTKIRDTKYHLSFNADDLTAEAERCKAIYTVHDGQIACKYCLKATDADRAFSRRIISFANYGREGKVFQYCGPTCADYDQMAHEG